MHGCAGLMAILFVVLVGILSYRMNKQHINDRQAPRFHREKSEGY